MIKVKRDWRGRAICTKCHKATAVVHIMTDATLCDDCMAGIFPTRAGGLAWLRQVRRDRARIKQLRRRRFWSGAGATWSIRIAAAIVAATVASLVAVDMGVDPTLATVGAAVGAWTTFLIMVTVDQFRQQRDARRMFEDEIKQLRDRQRDRQRDRGDGVDRLQ